MKLLVLVRAAATVCLLLGWMLTSDARESKPARPAISSPGNATIYVVRPRELKLISFAFPIVVDGQKGTDLTPGTYFVVRRSAGHHVVDINGNGMVGDARGEFDAVAGQTYVLEIAPHVDPPGAQLLNSLFSAGAGLRGQLLPGYGSVRFYLLNVEQGRAAIDNLQNVTR